MSSLVIDGYGGREALGAVAGRAERPPACRPLLTSATAGGASMHPMDQDMRRCVEACLACHRVCVTTASQHCLDVGGPHVEPRHFRLMLACAEICRTTAYFMELGTEFHKRTCAV